MKKLLSIILALCLLLSFAGCNKADNTSSTSSVPKEVVSEIEEEVGKFALNPLTGEEDLEKDAEKLKPVAFPC